MLPPNVQSLLLSSAKKVFAHHEPPKSGTTIQVFTTFGQSRHTLGLLPGYYQTAIGLLPGTSQTKPLMRTESLLCIAIPRVSAIFFTFQGNRLSCTTELYQPQCQPAPHWPPNVTVMASLSAYSVTEPLGLTLGVNAH